MDNICFFRSYPQVLCRVKKCLYLKKSFLFQGITFNFLLNYLILRLIIQFQLVLSLLHVENPIQHILMLEFNEKM